MNKSIWEKAVGKNTYKEIVGSCDRHKEEVYAKKRESIPFVKRRKRGGQRICKEAVEEGLYPAVKVTINGTGIFCRKER